MLILFLIACYFASLIQVMFHLPNISDKICSFNTMDFDAHFEKVKDTKDIDQAEKVKILASREIVKNL